MDEEDMVHVYSGLVLSYKMEGNNAIGATWMDPEMIIQSGVRQRKTNKNHLYVQCKM